MTGCYSCGQAGHFARDCTAQEVCHNCQEGGHKASECPHPQRCRRCAAPGHKESDCTLRIGSGSCYNCAKKGHFSKECPEPELCRNCQQPGHKSAGCTEPPACRRCRQSGHKASECSERRGEVCPFYASGSCKKGQQCDYEHVGAPGHASLRFYPQFRLEKRIAPDGRVATKAEFRTLYEGYSEWDAAERTGKGGKGKGGGGGGGYHAGAKGYYGARGGAPGDRYYQPMDAMRYQYGGGKGYFPRPYARAARYGIVSIF